MKRLVLRTFEDVRGLPYAGSNDVMAEGRPAVGIITRFVNGYIQVAFHGKRAYGI